MRIAAVVLTYNSPETIRASATAVLAQTAGPDALVVVDNAGDRPASEALADVLSDERLTIVRTERNLGPAGGFATGLRWVVEHGYDAAWVMDDDCVPDPDCLALLTARLHREPEPTVVFPQEIDGRDGSALNYPAWAAVLIPRAVIDSVGFPREEFFWWMEDTEYLFYRMRSQGVPVVRDEDARVIHERARRGGPTPSWKLYYETRNSTYMRLYVIKVGYKAWRKRIFRRFGYIVLRSPNRFTDLTAYLRGLFDGVFQRLGERYPVP